jgi:hypothetical protein
MQASYKLLKSFLHASYDLLSFPQISYNFYEFLTDFFKVSWKFHIIFLQTFFLEFLTNFCRASYKLHTSFLQTSYKLPIVFDHYALIGVPYHKSGW